MEEELNCLFSEIKVCSYGLVLVLCLFHLERIVSPWSSVDKPSTCFMLVKCFGWAWTARVSVS